MNISEEEATKKLLESATDYVITHDKKEANDLLKKFKDEATEESMDNVLELDDLVQVLFDGDFIDGEPVMLKIKDLFTLLENSSIPKSEQLRLKMLLTDIKKNRHRIYSILIRFWMTKTELKMFSSN